MSTNQQKKKMKTRKFLWAMLPMMAAALMTTACSSDDDSTSVSPKPAADQTVKTIPYTVTVGQGTTTRASVANDDVTLKFAAGDELYVENKSANVYGRLALKSGTGATSATFSGDLKYTGDEPATDLMLTATLVGADDKLAHVDGDKVMGFENYPTTVCATMADAVAKYSKLTGSSTYGNANFALLQQTAFLKFKVKLEDGTKPGDNAVAVTIKDGNKTLGTGTTVASGTEQFVATYAEFVLPAADGTSISTEAKMWVGSVGTPEDESIDLGNDNTLNAGYVYTVDKTKDFVRLWAGGPVWKSRNLDASSVSDYGKYYAWGETTGYALSESYNFSWTNYTYCNHSENYSTFKLTKYNTKTQWGTIDGKTTLESGDDAATSNLGSPWHMPAMGDFTDLLAKTITSAWTTVNSVKGRTFTGNTTGYTGKAIFLPAAGRRLGTELDQEGMGCYYWSTALHTDDPRYGGILIFDSEHTGTTNYLRFRGRSVRPIRN